MTTPGRAALLLVLTACGGQVGQTQRQAGSATSGGAPDSVAGRGATDDPRPEAGGGATQVADGGAASAVETGGAAREAAAGDAANAASPPIGSGSRYCENELYCFGLGCYAPPAFEQHVCVAGCQSDDNCAAHEVCLVSADLSAGCYRECQTPFDCDYGFDCFDFANRQQMLVCFPTPWARAWGPKHP